MLDSIIGSPYFGVVLTVSLYYAGGILHSKYKSPLFNPFIFALVGVILFLYITELPYDTYMEGGQYLTFWITPATVALAIRLEKNFKYLEENYVSILTGIVLGVIFHTAIILGLSLVFQFNGELFATLYPKSVTTAIAMGVSESLGGIVSLTVALVSLTGTLGTVIGPYIFTLTKITDPVAQGIALGAGAHGMGTIKAIEMGEIQGAMSSLSIIVTGLTVVALGPAAEVLLSIFF